MSEYSEKLKDPRWQKKRLEILERDGWKCYRCSAEDKTLHVHHIVYMPGVEPWNYDNELYETLCENCHVQETQYRQESERELLNQLKLWGYGWVEIRDMAEWLSKHRGNHHKARAWAIKDTIMQMLFHEETMYEIIGLMVRQRGNSKAGKIPLLRKAYADYLRTKRQTKLKRVII